MSVFAKTAEQKYQDQVKTPLGRVMKRDFKMPIPQGWRLITLK